MDNLRDVASDMEPAFGSHIADAPAILDDSEERRMQAKAYNYWTSLLNGRDFPSIEDLEPSSIAEFAKHSVLIDFTTGPASATTAYVGVALRRECDLDPDSDRLAEAPAGSLLSRLSAYYQQILDTQAPVGFEADFPNQRGVGQAYRGILMPFSSDGDTIDFVYGVFNWTECDVADEATDSGNVVPFERAPEAPPAPVAGLDYLMGRPPVGGDEPVYGEEDEEDSFGEEQGFHAEPASHHDDDAHEPLELGDPVEDDRVPFAPEPREFDEAADYKQGFHDHEPLELAEPIEPPHDVLELAEAHEEAPVAPQPDVFPVAEFAPEESVGHHFEAEQAEPPVAPDLPVASIDSVVFEPRHEGVEEPQHDEEPRADVEAEHGDASDHDGGHDWNAPVEAADELENEEAGLEEWLTAARATAEDAKAADGRSRQALYRALAQAYDFACAAVSAPDDYQRLLDEAAIAVQARAPMTAVAKLVFGGDYDKARLTEYAAALSFAARQGVEAGEFLPFIDGMEGGLKGLVEAERRQRRPDADSNKGWRERAAGRLRQAEAQPLDRLAGNGEFALVLVRRDASGEVVPVAGIADDGLLDKAMRKAGR